MENLSGGVSLSQRCFLSIPHQYIYKLVLDRLEKSARFG
jgi:hypothetical protein